MAEERPSGYRRKTLSLAATLVSVLLFTLVFPPSPAFSQEKDGASLEKAQDEKEIRQAFLTGLSDPDGTRRPAEIDIEVRGRHITMTGSVDRRHLQESLTCLLCTPDEAVSAARSLGARMAASARGGAPAGIMIDAEYEGRVIVDGLPLAPAVGTHPLEPGDHEITITTAKGSGRTRIPLSAGEQTTAPHLETTMDTPRNPRRVRWGVAGSGVGLTLAAVGGAFLVLNGQCVTVDTHCDSYHTLTGWGIGLVATGAILQGLLIWMLLPERSAEKNQNE